MSRRALFLLVFGAAMLTAVLLWRGLRPGPTDEDQIRAIIHDAARAAEDKRIGDAVRGLSDRFQGQQGLDKATAKQFVAFQVLRGTWTSVSVVGEKIKVEGDTARSIVDVVMSRSGKGTKLAELLPETASVHRFDFRWARERDGWKVITATWRPVTLEEAAAGPGLEP